MFYLTNPRVIEAADLKGVVSMVPSVDTASGDQLLTVVFRLDGRKRFAEGDAPPQWYHVGPDFRPALLEAEDVVARKNAEVDAALAAEKGAQNAFEAALADVEADEASVVAPAPAPEAPAPAAEEPAPAPAEQPESAAPADEEAAPSA